MKKLNLKLDELRIESFKTVDVEAGKGTVVGNMNPYTMRSCPQVGCFDSLNYCWDSINIC